MGFWSHCNRSTSKGQKNVSLSSSPEAGHVGRGGGTQYLSGFAPDLSQPRVTVAGGPGGPNGYGRGPPTRAHELTSERLAIARPCLLRGRDGSSCGIGHNPLHSGFLEFIISLGTTAPTSLHRRVLAAIAATANRLVRRLGVA